MEKKLKTLNDKVGRDWKNDLFWEVDSLARG